MTLEHLLGDEATRLAEFPVARDSIFMAHAGVCILPRRVATAMQEYLEMCCLSHQESGEVWRTLNETRVVAARLIGAKASEIALLGPTSLGSSLVANGFPWQAGDEIVCHHDDYPANVYPCMDLRRRGNMRAVRARRRFSTPETDSRTAINKWTGNVSKPT